MDVAGLLKSLKFELEGFQPQPSLERLWDIVARYKPQLITSYEGKDITDLHVIRRPMMQGGLLAFSVDRLEKLVIGTWTIMKKLCVVFIVGYPADGYDFPILASDITEKEDQAILILDLHPLADLVVRPAYRERYLDPLASAWKNYLDLNNDHNANSWYRSLLSPFSVTSRLKVTASDRSAAIRQLDCLAEYTEYFFNNLVSKAKPASQEEAREASVRKQAIKELYRTRDPGLGPLETALGASDAARVARLLY